MGVFRLELPIFGTDPEYELEIISFQIFDNSIFPPSSSSSSSS